MILAFGDDHRRPTRFERRNYVIKDKVVPRCVPSELGVERLDCGLFFGAGSMKPELGVTENHLMIKRSRCRLLLGADAVTNWTALHYNDRVVAILPRDRRRQAKQVSGLRLARDGLKADGGKVMAFVDDDVAVFGDDVRNDALPHKALHKSDVDVFGEFPLPAMDNADLLWRDIKKDFEASDPLVEKLPAMDEDQRVSAARRDQFSGDDGFAKSRGCSEHTCLVLEKRSGSLVLIWRQPTEEICFKGRAVHAFVAQLDLNPCITKKFDYIVKTSRLAA